MAPQIIGSPDYIRRGGVSGATLYNVSIAGNANFTGPILDSNGFESIIVMSQPTSVTDNVNLGIQWFFDPLGHSSAVLDSWSPVAGAALAIIVPVKARYMQFSQFLVSGADTSATAINIYGTALPFTNITHQHKEVPLFGVSVTLGSSATNTATLDHMYAGEAMINIDDNANNKWTAWLEYFDVNTATWIQFWSAHGPDKGQGWTERIILPGAPVRTNIRNEDTVSHVLKLFLVGL